MIDLSNNERPFGLLSPEEQKALREWPHGVEWFCMVWLDHNPSYFGFQNHLTYRTKPAPVTYPSVDWSHVADRFKVLAGCTLSEGGATFSTKGYGWVCHVGETVDASAFASYDPGTCPDSEAISYRPGCEPK